ncbi:butyrophilin subfamily 1 member A1-like isoform X2 [Mustela putorius furo]|uniref:Butyrophilin subfamily 1 member A1-like isoform X2 n=1 Tax=Mustela putorius furo TaxID=9669 RepID=A0A8U0RLC3_MUSPF|nr:butyrophilin subfamily 1 member A1-like isoform X2 [Mustela putorius furo]
MACGQAAVLHKVVTVYSEMRTNTWRRWEEPIWIPWVGVLHSEEQPDKSRGVPKCSRSRREEFMVIGPSEPIVAVLGGDIMLPCRVSPAMDVQNMELRWFRSKFSEAVLIYQNQREQREEQLAQYRGRTSLVKDFLTQGEAAVRIHNVQAFDNGLYTCFFRMGIFYEEAGLELKVAGVGSAPQVHITGPEEDGVRVVCMALGWFPKPQVQWRALSGEKFLTFSETQAQDAEGLFTINATLVVRDPSSGNVTCSVLNPILGQEKAMAIFIPEPFFPRSSPWKLAFMVILTVLMLLLLGAVFYIMREHTAKLQEMQEWEKLHRDKKEDQRIKEEALKARDWRKSVYLASLKKAKLYADWRKEKFQTLTVSLDPESAHSILALSDDKTSVTFKDSCKGSEDGVYSVLGHEGITSGCCYWEVEIKNAERSEWALGVCRRDVERKGWYQESPEKGFWVVAMYDNIFGSLPANGEHIVPIPQRVGVFLDLKEGDVSFYNMTDGSHLFSFPLASASGTLLPYFRLRSGNVSLTICSGVGGPVQTPLPFNNLPCSSEEPGSLPGQGFSSGCGVDGDFPGAESPLLPCGPEAMSP